MRRAESLLMARNFENDVDSFKDRDKAVRNPPSLFCEHPSLSFQLKPKRYKQRLNHTSIMSLGRKFKLNSGHEIPAVGLGTWVSYVAGTLLNLAYILVPVLTFYIYIAIKAKRGRDRRRNSPQSGLSPHRCRCHLPERERGRPGVEEVRRPQRGYLCTLLTPRILVLPCSSQRKQLI